MAKTPSRDELHLLSPIKWVEEEMRRQREKWGEQNKNLFQYYCALAEEFGEAGQAINYIVEGKADAEAGLDDVEYELLQTAAVAVSMVEAIRRRRGSHDLRTPLDTKCIKGELV